MMNALMEDAGDKSKTLFQGLQLFSGTAQHCDTVWSSTGQVFRLRSEQNKIYVVENESRN